MTHPVDLLGVGIVTPVGVTAPSAAAAVRAGISSVGASPLVDRSLERLAMGLVEEGALPPLVPALEGVVRSTRHRRMLRLAAPALREAVGDLAFEAPVPLFLGLPEPPPGRPDPGAAAFLPDLLAQAGVDFDLRQSLTCHRGRAAGLLALADALAFMEARRAPYVIVGAVDTYFDPIRLAPLDIEGRLKVVHTKDGFSPGEGAAFLVLRAPGRAARRFDPAPLAQIVAVGAGAEAGHLYSQEPYRGDGLAGAFKALFAALPGPIPLIRSVYGSFNGEGFWAKEWGVAQVRHAGRFAPGFRMDHPAEFYGDPGAAAGPLMIALGALAMKKHYRNEPCLVFCSSDREERAAALIRSVGV